MGKPPTEGIQSLPNLVTTSLGTLASLNALILETDYAGSNLKRDFLLKKIRTQHAIKLLEADETVLIGFCNGDMAIGDIATALGNHLPDPQDFQLWDNFVIASGIYWQTLRMFVGNAVSGVPVARMQTWNEDIQIGGGKGIPIKAGVGIQMFAFNPSGGALTTGSQLQGEHEHVGVFLEDTIA